MIKFEICQGVRVGERFFATIQDAQLTELETLFMNLQALDAQSVARHILEHQEDILQILVGVKKLPAEFKPAKPRKKRRDAGVPRKRDDAPVLPSVEPVMVSKVEGSGKYHDK